MVAVLKPKDATMKSTETLIEGDSGLNIREGFGGVKIGDGGTTI